MVMLVHMRRAKTGVNRCEDTDLSIVNVSNEMNQVYAYCAHGFQTIEQDSNRIIHPGVQIQKILSYTGDLMWNRKTPLYP